MSIFGFGTPSELTTHIGVMVKSATDSLRIGPDWTLNLQICDEVRRNRREFPDQAVRAIKRRLNDNDQQTVYLALILFEACMKNCGNDFASAVDKSAMDDMVKVAQGSRGIKNSEEALRLIATWARVYEHRKSSFPLFFDTFMHMKARGITFPKEDESAVMSYEGYERPASRRESRDAPSSAAASVAGSVESHGAPVHHGAAAAAAAPAAATDPVEDEFLKLQLDLSVVMEKVNLCREILQVSPGIQHDEALADVIGFLEACRDRMVDVIEAGTQGLLGEDLFAVALKVNDAVLRTLDAERTGTKIAVGEEDQAKPATDNLLDLSPTTPKPAAAAPPASAQFTEDLFAPLSGAKAPAAAAPAVADFDPFGTAAVTAAPVAASSAPTVVQATDPFAPARTPFVAPAPAVAPHAHQPLLPPQPPVQHVALVPPQAASFNPFEDFAAPPAATTAPAPVPAVDDFAILMGTPSKAPAPAPVPAPAPGPSSAAQEFDDFLASLENKK
eukprot:gene11765-8382_t